MIPLLVGTAIEPVRLFVHRTDGEAARNAAAAGGSGHRFVVDLTFSRLGRMQLDGLLQRRDKRFALIIRTLTPLPEEMRRDITALFIRSSDAVGLAGNVLFRPDGCFFDPPPASPPSARIIV